MHHSYGIPIHHFDWCVFLILMFDACGAAVASSIDSIGPKAFSSCSKDWNKQPVSIQTQSKLNSFLWHRVWTDLRQIRDVPSVNTHLLQQKRRAVYLLANVVTNRSFTNQQLLWLLSGLHHLPLQLWGTRRFLSFLWGISCRYQVPLCTGLSSCQNIFLSSTKCKVTVMIFTSLFWILF